MVKVRGVFREGSKVRPREALFQIFVILGCKTEASKMTKLMEEFRVRGDRQKSVAYGPPRCQKRGFVISRGGGGGDGQRRWRRRPTGTQEDKGRIWASV